MIATTSIRITRHSAGSEQEAEDDVAVEEPMEIRLDGHTVAVLMRTPGHDEELAAGFLITEGIVTSLDQVRKIEPRSDENRVLAFLQDDVSVDLHKLTRHLFTGSSCGLCGKATLDAIFQESPPVLHRVEIPDQVLLATPDRLREAQAAFALTGGLHAAGLFKAADGTLIVAREDIGRHNAVDKVIGHAARLGTDLESTFLFVSGRVSFEIVQKALAARIPAVAAVSAPSSLAIDFARRSGQTLIAFLRPPAFNRYA